MRTKIIFGAASLQRVRYLYYSFVGGGDWKVLVSMVVQPATSPLTISLLFFVSRVHSAKYIHISFKNILRATQTRVFFTQMYTIL